MLLKPSEWGSYEKWTIVVGVVIVVGVIALIAYRSSPEPVGACDSEFALVDMLRESGAPPGERGSAMGDLIGCVALSSGCTGVGVEFSDLYPPGWVEADRPDGGKDCGFVIPREGELPPWAP